MTGILKENAPAATAVTWAAVRAACRLIRGVYIHLCGWANHMPGPGSGMPVAFRAACSPNRGVGR